MTVTDPLLDPLGNDPLWRSTLGDEGAPPAIPFASLDLSRLGVTPPPPDWLVTDMIAREWLLLIGSKPGVGKSWTALDLALALTSGRPWLDHDVPSRARVLYLDAENGESLALERLHQLGGRPASIGDRLQYVTESIALPGRDINRLRATVESFRPDVVIIDTLASVAPSAERDTETSSEFLKAVWHLVRDTGAAMVLLVHFRKSPGGGRRDDPLDAFRGAGHLVGTAHRAITLESIVPNKSIFVMRDVKLRRGHKAPAARIAIVDTEADDGSRICVQVEGYVEELRSSYAAYLAEVIVFIGATTIGQASTAELIKLAGAPLERTAKEHLKKAVQAGVLCRRRQGWYSVPAGPPDQRGATQTAQTPHELCTN